MTFSAHAQASKQAKRKNECDIVISYLVPFDRNKRLKSAPCYVVNF